MSLNSYIQDPLSGEKANVLKKDGYYGLYVFTDTFKDFVDRTVFFSNPNFGINVNRNFSVVNNTENVHNGGDNIYWTPSIIVGSPVDFDFNSTTVVHTGAQSIDCTAAETGDQFQLLNDTLISDGDFDQLVGWLYISSSWDIDDAGLKISLYNSNTGLVVSDVIVELKNYVTSGNTGVWQRFVIPISKFGNLSNQYDAIRLTVSGVTTPPQFYLDDIQLLDVGGSDTGIYKIEPTKGTWWYVNGLGIIAAVPYSPVLADSTMPKIPYDGLLGVPLTNGITYSRREFGENIFSFVFNNLIEVLNVYDAQITNWGSDGTNTWIKIDIHFRNPLLFKSEFEDNITFQFNDDLSDFLTLRISANIKEEKRLKTGQEYDFENSKNI